MIKEQLLRETQRTGITFRVLFTNIRQVFTILIFLISLLGVNPTPVLADSMGLVCETFDAFIPGSGIGTYTGWTDGGTGPIVTAGVGVADSVGLGSSSSIYNWTAHPFNWNAVDFASVVFQQDFKTDVNGQFDDDRLSWTIDGASNASDNQFGVQLDHPNGGIVTYWSNTMGGTRINDVIVPLTAGGASGTQANTWYRFSAEITKLTATSAKIDVNLAMLDTAGNPTGTPITGSIADTGALASARRPAAGYFAPTTMVPSYKNYTTAAAPADNPCYEVITSPPSVQHTLTITNDGNGSVTLNPAGGIYNEGTVVTLTPVPNSGYEFDTWSGDNVGDLTDNGNGTWNITMNAEKSVAASFAEFSPSDYEALDFGTSNSYITFGPSLGTEDFTLETWFNWTGGGTTANTGNGGVNAIPLITKGLHQADNSNVDANYFLGITTAGKLAADFEALPGGQNYPVTGNTTITPNVWHHAAVTYDGQVWSLYLDGTLDKRLDLGTPRVPRYDSTQHAGLGVAIDALNPPTYEGRFYGKMDEARIWSYARTQADIFSTINSEITSPTSGLIGRWSLDEGNGTTVYGSAGTTVNGSITGSGYSWIEDGAPFNITPPVTHTLTVTSNGNGNVTLNPTGGIYNEGAVVTLTPVPNSGYEFDTWGGTNAAELIDNGNGTWNIAMNGDKTINANFAILPPPVALDCGSNQAYVTLGQAPTLGLTQFTIETWFRRDGTGSTTTSGSGGVTNAIPLVTKGRGEGDDPTNLNMNYLLGIRSSDSVLVADFEDVNTSNNNHPVIGTTHIVNGVWYHGAVTYNGSYLRLYLNGHLEAEVSTTAIPQGGSIQHAALCSALQSTGNPGTSDRGFFDGALDEVRIWNYGRSEQELVSTINSEITTSTTGLVGRWALNDGATSVNGSAGTTVNGSIVGTGYSWLEEGAPFNLSFNQAPNQPANPGPANGTLNVSTSPTLEATVTDPDTDEMDVTFYGRKAGAGTPQDFTIVVLPDTQNYSDDNPDTYFAAQTQWIVNNKINKNIIFVTHEGDVVNTATDNAQYVRADAAMDLLDAANIPYSLGPGNHDYPLTNYNNTFGVSRFTGKSFYGGHYPSTNENNYSLFSASGMDFLIINLEYAPSTAALDWADARLKEYSNRRAIVVSHELTGTGNPSSWQGQGLAIYTALSDNPNLFLMLAGHVHGEGQREDINNGNKVYTLMADYQNYTNGGNGYLRILEFSPANDIISVKTYSPTLGIYETDAASQFTLAYDMEAGDPFEILGTDSDVASGGSSSITWPTSLAHNTQYEWYVDISDGSLTTHGPTWNFTTVPPTCYALTVAKNGNGAVPVANPVKSLACTSDGRYVEGEVITLSGEAPATGWHLGSWYGTTAGSNSLTMPASAHSAGINYLQDEYALTVSINPPGSGAVTPDNLGPYHYGDSVELTAAPVAGWMFTGWSGDLNSTDNPANITMNGSKSVTANFTQIGYSLNVTPVGSGTVAKSPNQTTYHYNDVVTLTPAPATGWVFSNWGGDANGTSNPLQVTINGNKNITATFTQLCYTLTTAVDPVSGGNITAAPAPNCDSGTKYTHGTIVTLTAAAASGYGFDQWSGAVSGSTNPQTITMDSDKSVTAKFALNAVSLIVSVSPSGSGSVSQSPSGPYFYGAEVTLTANPAMGWHFVQWTGDMTGNANPAVITMNGDKTVTAVFAKDPVTLTVNVLEGGSVTKNPSGSYLYGDTVQLTAVPNTGWHFVQWGGALSGSTNPADIILNGDRTVTATFARNEYTLSVSVAPLGGGTVTRDLNQATYLYGDVITLTANANSGWSFTNWSGDASGNTNPKSVTITDNTNIIANFTQTTLTHSISLQQGWNLVSFNLHPLNTNIANVLSSIQGNYDLVYAWDATGAHAGSGNWMKYDNIPLSPDTLLALDETMGFWIHMTAADTLDVQGTIPVSSHVSLRDDTGGWNLVAYPSAVNGHLPEVLRDQGVGTDFSLIYAYHANDIADAWKLFDRSAPSYANDLTQLTPGWGYWIKVSADKTWDVNYAVP